MLGIVQLNSGGQPFTVTDITLSNGQIKITAMSSGGLMQETTVSQSAVKKYLNQLTPSHQ